ncbi:MAG TPA: exosortase A [Terriglobales bacterium]|nr:exosortase A [Terriglobales bacterium]
MGQLAQAVTVSGITSRSFWKRDAVWQAMVIVALVGWLYAPVLARLVQQWWFDSNFSHGFFVPIFSLVVIWNKRFELASIPRTPNTWGVALILAALSTLVLGIFGAELFLSRISLLLLIAGLIVFFGGTRLVRALMFPLVFLVLMVPIPAIIFSQITFPLQILASRLSAWILPVLGVPVLREGNVINLPAMPLEVAEACSGIRSLLSLITLAIIYGYFLEKRISTRVALAIASIPIAVVANGLRIVGTGLLVQYWDPDKAEGFFHAFSGWLVFVVSLLMLYFVHRCLEFLERDRGEAMV